MKVIYGISNIKKFRRPVVALGVFDGVHQGHQRILKAAVDKARHIKGTSVVVTFWPHPQKENSIYSLEHRLRLVGQYGINICIVIRFNKQFSRITAEDFIRDILVDRIGARYIYIGHNFRFGKEARGNCRTLDKLSKIYGFKLKVFDIVRINNQAISSTYIRRLITQGKLDAASRLLTRPVSILGTVIEGTSLATKLGFPTANIDPHHEVLPPSGIYAVRILYNNQRFNGACYIGTKPTFRKEKQKRVEAHIFNFRKNIYGKYLEIQFIKKIRDDKKFGSPDSLARQIKKDIILAKRLFSLPS